MPYRSRILDGGCSWLTLPDVDARVVELRGRDPYTVASFVGMQRDATTLGMIKAHWVESLDFRVPINRAPQGVIDPPWTGELKVDGKRRKNRPGLTWRMYFCEPAEITGLIVICGLGWKDPTESARQGAKRQNDSIKAAMELFKGYCRQEGLTYPPF